MRLGLPLRSDADDYIGVGSGYKQKCQAVIGDDFLADDR